MKSGPGTSIYKLQKPTTYSLKKLIKSKQKNLEIYSCTWMRCHTHFHAARENTGAIPSTHLVSTSKFAEFQSNGRMQEIVGYQPLHS